MKLERAFGSDIVCFSHLRWRFVFQRPQHLMTRWAKEGRVFFVEEPQWSEGEPRWSMHQDDSGVQVWTPLLPKPEVAPDVNASLRQLLAVLFSEQEITDFVSWYYTPMAWPFTSQLEPTTTVYDCMDELSSFRGAHSDLPELERQLLSKADVVFTGGHHLYEAKKRLHHNVHPFPSSVDVPHFAQARESQPDPLDQAHIPHPRLGFFGVLDERFDCQLVSQMAAEKPDWQVVLIGPICKIDPASLPSGPNVHLLGMKQYDELPTYLSGWDVALLPFAINDATRYISPTKTPEYLAGGLPVVSTPIHDVVHPYEDNGLVRIARTTEQLISAVEASLSEDPSARVRKSDRFLANLSWDTTFAEMKELVEAPKVAEPAQRSAAPRFRRPAFDYLVAGAGFAGAVMAERMADAGKRVLLVDKRPHVGGNAYDRLDLHGVRIHEYGPHIFHTNSADVFDYLSRFTAWRNYEHRVLANVDGKLLPMPINLDTINGLYGWHLTSEQLALFFAEVAEPRANIATSEDVIISKVGRALYEKFFKNYTIKQWGLSPAELDASVIARIPVRTNRDDRYFADTYQAMPADGFTAMFERMLDHPNITLELGADCREVSKRVSCGELIYTGPVDEYFGCCYGKLPYRSIDFRFETHDTEQFQSAAVVNYPNEHAYTRITEFKHLTGQKHAKTTVVYEYPTAEGAPYYPVPRPQNAELYRRYQALALNTPRVHFVGRLATYRYYNMDQVVAQALTLASKLNGLTRSELLAKRAQ